MYQIKSIHDEQSFPYSLSTDGESLVGIFITDSERESFGRFKPETRQLLLDRYLDGIGNGLTDGSDELFQYVTEGLSVATPSKFNRYLKLIQHLFANRILLSRGETKATNIICEERGGLISLKLGNVSIGDIVYKTPEIIIDEKEEEKIEQEVTIEEIGKVDIIEEEKEEQKQEQEDKEEEKDKKEEKNGHGRQPWWNINKTVLFILVFLLAAVAFFVTLLLTGKLSLGNKGGNTQRTEQTDTTQAIGMQSDTTTKSKLTKEQIIEIAKYQEGLARVKGPDGLYGFADKAGKVIIPCQWADAHPFHQGLAVVKDESGLWGYIDPKGKLVIPCKWKEASDFDASGTASVINKYNEKYKIDKGGAIMRNTDNLKK
ncbi:MAG: WG repeat-containing protein [Prevotella sp.]|nr:WG repeat-containing protein [Prevotella sp.]